MRLKTMINLVSYCFIVDTKGIYDMEPSVVFIGYDATGIAKCQWESGAIRTFHNVSATSIPPPFEIGKPTVKPKNSSVETEQKASGCDHQFSWAKPASCSFVP